MELPLSLLDGERISVIKTHLSNVANLEGDIAEVGVYKGGVAYHLNKFSNGKKVYLFDTFEGMPFKGKYDRHIIGDFGDTSHEEVAELFYDSPNVKIIKGVFPDSARSIISRKDKFCFVHLDADQYESTLEGLKFFYDKMVVGGVVVCDDYGWLKGVDKAIGEFLKDKPEKEKPTVFAQCIIVKQ